MVELINRVENITGKGENATRIFSFYPGIVYLTTTMFSTSFFSRVIKPCVVSVKD